MKRISIHHVNEILQMESVGDHLPQWSTVTVFHPAIRADEPDRALRHQVIQGLFDERNIQVRPIVKRIKAMTVFRKQNGRDQFLPHVRGITHDMSKLKRQIGEKEIALY